MTMLHFPVKGVNEVAGACVYSEDFELSISFSVVIYVTILQTELPGILRILPEHFEAFQNLSQRKKYANNNMPVMSSVT